MPDRWVVTLALAAAVGALRPSSVPVVAAVAGVLAAGALRRPALLCLAVALLVSGLASRSLAGLALDHAGDVTGEVVLVTDPEPALGGVRAEARLGGRRVELRASGVAEDALRPRLAGERVWIRGELTPLRRSDWTASRHLAGRVRVLLVERWRPGGPAAVAANGLRRTLVAGAAPLTEAQRSLYTGLVFGDDRDQPAALADDFRGAGLTHLLAVSGQNIAFLLGLAQPVLLRLRLWPRALLSLGLVGLFGVMTRFEPSVTRAAAMACVAVLTTTVGAPQARVRVLALAVTAAIVVDPMLVRSVGFRLSVGAAAAIVVVADRLAAALPGPRWLVALIAVTVAAQLGVAPVLLATFGPLPVASLPANLLAGPAAGLVMAWGLTGGLLAGVLRHALGGGAAQVLHAPTTALLVWLEEVAARTAALPLGQLGAPHVAALALGVAALLAAQRSRARSGPSPRGRRLRTSGLVLTAAAGAAAALASAAPVPLRTQIQPGVVRWHAAGTDVLVLGGAGGRTSLDASGLLAALREHDVGAVELLVLADDSVPLRLVDEIEARHPVGVVVADGAAAPPSGAAEDPRAVALAPPGPETVVVGSLEVRLTPTADRIVVEAARRP